MSGAGPGLTAAFTRLPAPLRRAVRGTAPLLVALLVAHAAVNLAYIARDRSLRSFDAAPHLEAVAHTRGVIDAQGVAGVLAVARGEGPGTWPTAGYLLWSGLSLLFGLSAEGMRAANLLFFTLLVVSVFALGRRLSGDRAGLLAAALVSLYPVVYSETRQFGADMPGAAMIALCLTLLADPLVLRRPARAARLGLCVGVAMLLRPQVLFFLGLPLALVVADTVAAALTGRGLLDVPRRPSPAGSRAARLRQLALPGLAAAVAAVVTAPWWYGRLGALFELFWGYKTGTAEDGPTGVMRYLPLTPWAFSPVLLILLVVGCGVAAVRLAAGDRRWLRSWRRPEVAVVAACLVGGVLVTLSIKTVYYRFLTPLAPLLALATATLVDAVRHTRVRQLIVGWAVLLAVVMFLIDTFAVPLSYDLRENDKYGFRRHMSIATGPPVRDSRTVTARAAARLLRARHGDGVGVVVHLVDRHAELDAVPLSWPFMPELKLAMPRVRITGDTYYDTSTDAPVPAIGGAPLPLLEGPPVRCYVLRFDQPGHERPHGDAPAVGEVLLSAMVWDFETKVRVTLFAATGCPER